MFEESMSVLPNLWSSVNSWFTPTVLFVLLNLMIGTIAITSGLISQKNPHQEPQQQRDSQLPRSPSVLQRLKSSSNFFQGRSPEQQHQAQFFDETQEHEHDEHQVIEDADASSVTEEIRGTHDVKLEEKSIDEVYSELLESVHVSRTKSEPAGKVLLPLPKRRMKKSASAKSTFAKFSLEDNDEEDFVAVESRRPATMREKKAELEVEGADDDEEVDAKADDFINSFKQQLKLQRIDSIMRNKEEVLGRGSIGKK